MIETFLPSSLSTSWPEVLAQWRGTKVNPFPPQGLGLYLLTEGMDQMMPVGLIFGFHE